MRDSGRTAPISATVVVPCFNYGRFVRFAVESALRQVDAVVDVVVVNDGSTDGKSARLCDRCRGPRVTVIHQENGGPAVARNRGAADSRGEFLVFLDADDWIEPEFVSKLGRALRESEAGGAEDVSHAYSQQRMVERTGSSVWKVPEWDPLTMMIANLHPVTAVVKRERFTAVGGFSEGMREGYEDWDLWLKFVERGWRGVRVAEPLFVYRRHSPTTHNRQAIAIHEALFRRIVRAHAGLYGAHADELVARMNLLLRQHNMNWLDESGEPIALIAMKRQRAMYEAMPAVKAHHAIHRMVAGLPWPLSAAARRLMAAMTRLAGQPSARQVSAIQPAVQGTPKSELSAKNSGTPAPSVGPVVTVLPAGSMRVSWAKIAPSTGLPARVNSAETEIE